MAEKMLVEFLSERKILQIVRHEKTRSADLKNILTGKKDAGQVTFPNTYSILSFLRDYSSTKKKFVKCNFVLMPGIVLETEKKKVAIENFVVDNDFYLFFSNSKNIRYNDECFQRRMDYYEYCMMNMENDIKTAKIILPFFMIDLNNSGSFEKFLPNMLESKRKYEIRTAKENGKFNFYIKFIICKIGTVS